MAPKRKGLGRGLDALIRDVNAEETTANTTEKAASTKTSAKKTGKAEVKGKTAAAKSAKSGSKAVKAAAKDAAPAAKTAPEKPETPKTAADALKTTNGETVVRLSLVEPNREQPRKTFSDESINELADSIRQFGVIQPLLVQLKDDHYEIIAGERRWRAAKEAGLKEIPVLVREYSTQEAVEVSLIENIQREDLNPIEEAKAYRNLMTDFELRQEDVAKRVSKSRAAVANSMRLLKLDQRVQDLVIEGKLTEGHARALLALENGDQQLSVAEEIIKDYLTVRQVEQLIRRLNRPASAKKTPAVDPQREAVIMSLSEKLKSVLGTKVEINQISKKKGRIEIEYYSDDDLERVYELLMTVQGE